jgi:UDP-MurNAc hydroxylase
MLEPTIFKFFNMKVKILSHACVLLSSGTHSIVIDPWLLGSCYWRSWWNFPEPEYDEHELNNVDAVVISHIHWDHWHGPTLKKLFKGKPIFVPDEPGLRSERDLNSIGFMNVNRVPHAVTVNVGDISLTMYQFGLFLNDAAIVVEANGVALLNANDAKIAGWALRHLLSRHGRFDFALRSHSSANSRICFKIEGKGDYVSDDREHYFRSFVAFMDAVQPRYAVPFASNHCHLHDDVYELNSYISNPFQLREYVNGRPSSSTHWQMAMMLPGSTWSPENGFSLRNQSIYKQLDLQLEAYRLRVKSRLDAYTLYENSVRVDSKIVNRFIDMFRHKEVARRAQGDFLLTVRWPDGRGITYLLNLPSLKWHEVTFTSHSKNGLPNLIFPAVVFRDAVIKNMFHHAVISKRCEFLASSEVDLGRTHHILGLLEGIELGRYPWSFNYSLRLISAYIKRWRELFVYAHALWLLKIRRKPIYITEESILRGEF